jgi:hypothetical protein
MPNAPDPQDPASFTWASLRSEADPTGFWFALATIPASALPWEEARLLWVQAQQEWDDLCAEDTRLSRLTHPDVPATDRLLLFLVVICGIHRRYQTLVALRAKLMATVREIVPLLPEELRPTLYEEE